MINRILPRVPNIADLLANLYPFAVIIELQSDYIFYNSSEYQLLSSLVGKVGWHRIILSEEYSTDLICHDRYVYFDDIVHFKKEEDALMFKMAIN